MEQVPPHLQHLVVCSTKSLNATSVLEDVTYPVIVEALLVHKNPPHRFTIYPQITLRWKPTNPSDIRSENPDVGLVNFRADRPFDYRLGIESKSFKDGVMAGLPHPDVVASKLEVQHVLWEAYLQAEDQAKAAVRGEHLPQQRPLGYLLFVGPYWTHVALGPFDWENLAIRTHKESPSGDWAADWRAKMRLRQEPVYRKLWLVGTLEFQRKMEEVISSTEDYGRNGMLESGNFKPGQEFVLQ